MVGRKAAVPPADVIKAVLLFKDRILIDDEGVKMIVPASNVVWTEISSYLDWRVSKNALHTFVHQGRHGIKEKLGILKEKCFPTPTICETNTLYNTDEFSDLSSSDEVLPKKKFVITFSECEWEKIHPQEVYYKINDKTRPFQKFRTFNILPKNVWTPVIAEHFWIHTQLPCCLSFRRSNVYPNGSNYVVVVGRCTICNSHFKGVIAEKPPENSRVLMQCEYIGDFDQSHSIKKKRRMIGPVTEKALKLILNDGISCETFREREAVRLMKEGELEPSIIPTGNALRVAKSKDLKLRQRHSDPLTAILMMKLEDTYKDCIHDIGLDPFFVYIYTPELINLYRAYSSNSTNPSLIIDATGTVVKKFSKLSLIKTQTLYLYEAVVHDDIRNHTFTVCSMISERHDNIAIYHWLSRWLKIGVPPPKETCSDMSLALLSAIVRAFTQYSSLNDYINACSLLTLQNASKDSFLIPRCFIRIDVAHFVKNLTKWLPFKTVSKRVKEVYLRVICLIIKSESLSEIRSLILSIFVVASNESAGHNIETNLETPCLCHKNKLIEAASFGFIHVEHEFNNIFSESNNVCDKVDNIQEYDDVQSDLEQTINPFTCWVNTIESDSRKYMEEGNDLNPLYLPEIIPLLKKEIKMLPLWSGIMIPIFGYGKATKSSAAVESMFQKIKNITFKDIELPTSLETFIERRVSSLKGSALLKNIEPLKIETNSQKTVPTVSKRLFCSSGNLQTNNSLLECYEPINNISFHEVDEDTIQVIDNNRYPTPTNKIQCQVKEFPTKKTQNSVIVSKVNSEEEGSDQSINSEQTIDSMSKTVTEPHVTNLQNSVTTPNSSSEEVDSDRSMNSKRSRENILKLNIESKETKLQKFMKDEDTAIEKWSRKSQRKRKSYLTPNAHLKHLDLNVKKLNKSLPLLKNGSRAEDLKALNIKGYGKIILTNTCAFDTAVSLLMVAMCDSDKYLTELNLLPENNFIAFVKTILCNGISVNTYRKRAEIIIEKQAPPQTPLKYNQMLVKCETTFNSLLKCVIPELPTIRDKTMCPRPECKEKLNLYSQITYIYDGNFDKLEESINQRLQQIMNACTNNIGEMKCNKLKTLIPTISKEHIFIEVLHKVENSNINGSVNIKLSDIPSIINIQNIFYELRGVCAFSGGDFSSIGHYKAFCKRNQNNWELFDDLALKSIPIKENTEVQCESIFYTV